MSRFVAVVALAAIESVAVVQWAPAWAPSRSLSVVYLVAAAINFALLGVYDLIIYPWLLSPLRHIPGPSHGKPFIGQHMALFEKPPGGSLVQWSKTIPNNGIIRFRGFMHRDMLFPTTPSALAEILVAKPYMFEKPSHGRQILETSLGLGLVVVEGDVHKFQRKNVMPSFSFRNIKNLYPMMWAKSQLLCERVASEFAGEKTLDINVVDWSTKATLDIIGVAAIGRDFNSLCSAHDDLIEVYQTMGANTPMRRALFAASILFGPKRVRMLPFKEAKRPAINGVRLREIAGRFVREKREVLAKSSAEHHDILSSLILSDNFSDDELVAQVLTLLAAGHDTTSYTFTWVNFVLSKYPHVQTKLRAELEGVQAELEQGGDNLASILEHLPYLNGVVHEVFRLYPTVPSTARVCVAPTTIVGHAIPKGTEFALSMVAINRLASLWGEDAEEFKPERWIDADTGHANNHGGAPSNYALLTFLAGPRSCIGQNFAKAELRCLVASWILNYSVELSNPAKEPVASGAVTLKPMGGMPIRLTKLNAS